MSSQGVCSLWNTSMGKNEIITRAFTIIIPLICLLLISIALGINNSSDIEQLPTSPDNCTCSIVDDALNPVFLRRIVNIYGGVAVGVASIAILYQGIVFILRLLTSDFFKNNMKCFLNLDIILNNIFMGLFIGIMLGACVMPIILQIYQRIFLRGDDSDAARALQRVITCFWIAFGFSISSFYQCSNMAATMSRVAGKCYGNDNKCKSTELEEIKQPL